MSRTPRRGVLELGHDAFLDIVANLVGILIILVVVLGAQSSEVVEKIRSRTPQEADPTNLDRLAQLSMRAASAQSDSNRLERLIEIHDARFDAVKSVRDRLLDMKTRAEQIWAEKQSEQDQYKLAAAKRVTELERGRSRLAKLRGQRVELENRPSDVIAVEHLPSPMAKTVFGDEVHFRLKDGLISVVPIQALEQEIKRVAERMFASSREGALDDVAGPISGYVAKLLMEKQRGLTSRGGKLAMAQRLSMRAAIIEPIGEPHGQDIDKVFAGNSVLDIELAGRDPATTTVTVWVYPDDFGDLRRLKEYLYARGFAAAARPLPHDYPIRMSAQGSRSRAQ